MFLPAFCEGCGADTLHADQLLCLQCLARLPETGFFAAERNPVEKTFYGRIPVVAAGAAYYFTKDSLVQHLITQLKYRNKKEIGTMLGQLTGLQMLTTDRFLNVDCVVPLPLNKRKLYLRGYNQAEAVATGIASMIEKPVLPDAVERKLFTETQTHKDRVHRWQNMQEVFAVADPQKIANRHILLVDDVITTGATLEACGNTILQVPGTTLSIATVAWTI